MHLSMPSPPKESGAMGHALTVLKGMIYRGELLPGEQIRQEEMALRLTVSRVPLREAMNVLADQGLLDHRPNQGYFVVQRSAAEFSQIRRMLHLLENELMETIQWPSAAQLNELRALNATLKSHTLMGDLQAMIDLNREFHFQIFKLSPNHVILHQVKRLLAMVEPAIWSRLEHMSDRLQTVAEHARILDALALQDRVAALREMNSHRHGQEAIWQTGPAASQ